MKVDSNLNYQLLLKDQNSSPFSPGKTDQVALEKALSGDRFTPNGRPFSNDDSVNLYSDKSSTEKTLTNGTDSFVSAPKLSADQASQNILGFIERRLMSEKAQGADDERLADLMAQAREGVDRGYEQARKDLESLSMLNEELGAEIDQSYSLVSDGLDQLEKALFPDAEQTVETLVPQASSTEVYSKRVEQESFRSESVSSQSSAPSSSARSTFQATGAYSSSSEFSLRTQDGDVVKISFSSMQAFQLAAEKNVGGMAAEYRSVSASEFAFSISGDLDEEELTAINDLLAQLSEVADAFFSGDMVSAFESAMSLGFDGGEIAEFSLNLRQSQFEQVKAYTETPASFTPSEPKFQPFVDQVSRMEQLSQLLERFEFEKASLTEMFDQLMQEKNMMEPLINQPVLENMPKFFERLL